MTTLAQAQRFAGKRRRKTREALPASQAAHACVVLAVDTAKNSGVALFARGRLVTSGELQKNADAKLRAFCEVAIAAAEIAGVPCVLVLEKPPRFVYRGRTASTMVGLGAAREAWERAWRDAGGKAARIVRVEPGPWRRAVLGTSKHVAELEMRRAQIEIGTHAHAIGADEAAAVCIGVWACKAGEVLAAMPKRRGTA